ncbi:Ral guanine nucleotide dissociation stimulator [Vulpes lagopus]
MQEAETIPDGHNGFSGVKTREEWKVVSEPRDICYWKMFSCCLPRSRDFGSQQPQGRGFYRLQSVAQPANPMPRSSTWDNGRRRRREEEDIPDTPVVIRKEPSTANGGLQGFKAERASALRRNRICPTTPSRRELLEQQVELVPALLRLHNLSLFEFLNVLEDYGTPEEVLDLLFANRCRYFSRSCPYRCIVASCKKEGVRDQWEIAMSSFLTIWLEYYEEDFHDPPEFPALTKLLKFTGQYVPGSVLDCRAECYLRRFINLHQAEFEDGALAPKQHPVPPQEPAPAPTVGSAAPSGPEVTEPVPTAGGEGLA